MTANLFQHKTSSDSNMDRRQRQIDVPPIFANLMDPVNSTTTTPSPTNKALTRKAPLPPMAFADAGETPDPSGDYTTLLQKLKSKQRRRAPSEAEDVIHQSMSHSSVPFSSASLHMKVPNRRQSFPYHQAAKYHPGTNSPPPLIDLVEATKATEVESEGYLSEGRSVASQHLEPQQRRKGRIRVVVRKRPVPAGEEDVVEVDPPVINVNAQKVRIDLSEYTEAYQYSFDDAFSSSHDNAYVYDRCGKALIDTVFEGGSASCFAYGQTGSGKTHTMLGTETDMGFYMLAAQDIFERCGPDHKVSVSLFEIYCNSLFDLLNARSVVIPREDSNKKVIMCGLTWKDIGSVSDLRWWIERGAEQRRTGSTSANEFSSRSHAVMTIGLRNERDGKFQGYLKLVDLAGSERAADTAAHDRQTRLEGAEINKSLLALKECIRGLDERKKHIPFRGSKLTEVLRDSFEGNSRTVMIAAVTPAAASVVHTLNTLRYAFRVKGLSIDQNVVPGKQRKSKVAPTRSKSTEPSPVSILAQPLPPLFTGRRDGSPVRQPEVPMVQDEANIRKVRKHRKLRSKANESIPGEAINALKDKVGADIATLRQEMLGVIHKKDEAIEQLNHRNEELERRLEKLLLRIAKAEMNLERKESTGSHSHGDLSEY